jgi:hypothetical protein
MSWQDQLEEVVVDKMFGSNTDWHIEDVKKYITKLESLGAWRIEILDMDTLRFELPVGDLSKVDVLMFILTGGEATGRMPTSVTHNKKKRTVTLNFDW